MTCFHVWNRELQYHVGWLPSVVCCCRSFAHDSVQGVVPPDGLSSSSTCLCVHFNFPVLLFQLLYLLSALFCWAAHPQCSQPTRHFPVHFLISHWYLQVLLDFLLWPHGNKSPSLFIRPVHHWFHCLPVLFALKPRTTNNTLWMWSVWTFFFFITVKMALLPLSVAMTSRYLSQSRVCRLDTARLEDVARALKTRHGACRGRAVPCRAVPVEMGFYMLH